MAKLFNAFFKELEGRLGDKYAIWQEFSPQNVGEYLQRYDNLGTLYVNSSSINVLPKPLDGIKANCTLELTMLVKDTTKLSDVIIEPLNVLVRDLNGSSTEGVVTEDGETTTLHYFIAAQLPTGDGDLIDGARGKYVRFQIPFTVTISQKYTVYAGDDVSVTIGGQTYPIGGVVSTTESLQLTKDTLAFVNQNKNLNIAMSSTWLYQVTVYNVDDDPAQMAIRAHLLENPLEPFTLTLTRGGGDTTKSVLVQATYARERGSFTRNIYDFFEAVDFAAVESEE